MKEKTVNVEINTGSKQGVIKGTLTGTDQDLLNFEIQANTAGGPYRIHLNEVKEKKTKE